MSEPIKVVVVDDSALIRRLLSSLLEKDPEIKVVGTAADPYQARTIIKETNPDVITLDIEMPKMDGLAFLEKIMTLRPMPVIMVSSLTRAGAEVTLHALELGAVDFFGKPSIDLERGMEERSRQLIAKVKAAARAKVAPRSRTGTEGPGALQGYKFSTTEKIIAIGSSTGGVEALREVIPRMPANCPGILVAQHMPANFTGTFAQRMNGISNVTVSEAQNQQRILPGHVYIAPGSYHLKVKRSGANYVCQLSDEDPVTGHKPSVDVLFDSVAEVVGANAVGVILTGMGKDGASGLKNMRDAGAATIGQDEPSSVVYGMPKVAFEMGGVEEQMDIRKIAEAILQKCAVKGAGNIRV
ncbi:protein-glutamate methylesterase/protein-glutamine glutaminase [Aestuariispira insulae]|uniref:Protein-glutamate methylesterase/protein-glutamine glutaminase n=1 Tax=Aestuariispira insulae TaxID=1461337 RepID=A0A3D9HXH3_9PROT|nr:chemotaxis response regulator protein-glutamate methylesterase [Aestuariispira insulae]RED54071.1 two-component system chemotaxis response regulator CheB [Aestuariispira insulae]